MSGDFQIGEWRVQPAVNRIARGDRVVRIEPKVMQVLVCLAERAGEVVTREQLISRVWSDVFVTDDVLHRAIRELRRVFGDSTTQPAYIETIRKRGYRLMVPIGQAEAEALTLESTAPADKGLLASPTREGAVVHTAPRWSFSVVAAFVALLTAIGVVIVASRSHEATSEAHARFVPVVSGPLNESDPAISPDGQRIAFVQRTADASSSADIYIRDLASGRVTRVTLGSSSDRMPAWSPDASRLAFIRSTSSSCDIVIRSLSTDIDSMIAPCTNLDDPRVAWTQDGRALITSRAPDAHAASGWQLARLDIATATATPITSPPHGVVGDHAPSVSPDGRRVAFIRRSSGGVSDLYVSAMNGTEERRLTFDGADLTGVDWTGDGRSLVYSSDRAGGYTLWRIAAEGGTPALLAGGAARMKHPVADRSGRRVVYENWNYEINLAEKRFREPGGVVHSVTRTSDLWNLYPQVCPDDRRITYVSTQSGSHELWVADREGTNARQLTRLGDGIVKLPRWSPDGRRIVFLARGERSVDIYHVDVTTGDVTRVTSDSRQEVAPAWSADGARILFGAADEHGRWNVWSVNASDPADARVELRDAVAAQPSYDGHTLYFTRPNQSGVWRVSSSGARVERVVDGIDIGNTQGWSVMRDSIYFVEERGDTVYLRELTLMSGAIAEVAALPQFTWPGFSVSKDGAVLYAKWDRRESNLMSIEY